MSGEANSVIDSRWDDFLQIAEQYLSTLEATKLATQQQDVHEALNLTRQVLKILNAEDCLIYAYILDRHALVLQEEINKHNGKHNWAKHNLEVAIGNVLSSGTWGTNYTKYEEKKMMVISNNKYCKALNEMSLQSLAIIQHLEGLSYKVNTIAKTLKDLAYHKRKAE